MELKLLKNVKKGEFVTINNHGLEPDEKYVYVRGEYNKFNKKYELYKYNDINHVIYKSGNIFVYTDFIF